MTVELLLVRMLLITPHYRSEGPQQGSYEPVRHGPVHAVFFYYMSNRVEHQKLNQEAAELPPG